MTQSLWKNKRTLPSHSRREKRWLFLMSYDMEPLLQVFMTSIKRNFSVGGICEEGFISPKDPGIMCKNVRICLYMICTKATYLRSSSTSALSWSQRRNRRKLCLKTLTLLWTWERSWTKSPSFSRQGTIFGKTASYCRWSGVTIGYNHCITMRWVLKTSAL